MGDLFGKQRSMTVNESAENIVTLLCQLSCIGFRIFDQFGNFGF